MRRDRLAALRPSIPTLRFAPNQDSRSSSWEPQRHSRRTPAGYDRWLIVELERTIDAEDRVLSLHRARMKMRLTGLEFEMPVAYLFTFQEGKVVHARAFADHAEALKAVGLEE